MEGYIIKENGSILQKSDFRSLGLFTLLRTIGAQTIITCKNEDKTDVFSKGNIDVVVTPDIAVSAMRNFIP